MPQYASVAAERFADIVDAETYIHGVPHATFQRLRDEDPVSGRAASPSHDDGDGST